MTEKEFIFLMENRPLYKRPMTIFCDIDGTILYHHDTLEKMAEIPPILLDGVKEKFSEWRSKNHKIILTTARPESMRDITERHLREVDLEYDYLLMDMTDGIRVVINDYKPFTDDPTALAYTVERNNGFNANFLEF